MSDVQSLAAITPNKNKLIKSNKQLYDFYYSKKQERAASGSFSGDSYPSTPYYLVKGKKYTVGVIHGCSIEGIRWDDLVFVATGNLEDVTTPQTI